MKSKSSFYFIIVFLILAMNACQIPAPEAQHPPFWHWENPTSTTNHFYGLLIENQNPQVTVTTVGEENTLVQNVNNEWQVSHLPYAPPDTTLKVIAKNAANVTMVIGTFPFLQDVGWVKVETEKEWKQINLPRICSGFNSIWADTTPYTDRFWVVGDYCIFQVTDRGTKWSLEMTSSTKLTAIFGQSHYDIPNMYVVGEKGVVLHYTDKKKWNLLSTIGTTENLNGVWIDNDAARTIYIVGEHGTLFKGVNQSWSTPLLPSTLHRILSNQVTFRSIFGLNGEIVAVGNDGVIACKSANEPEWFDCSKNITADHLNFITGISVSTHSVFYVAGEHGTILMGGTENWKSIVGAVTQENILSIYSNGIDEAYAVGANGTLLKNVIGVGWTNNLQNDFIIPYQANLNSIHGHQKEFYAVGDYGTILHRKDNQWEIQAEGLTNQNLHQVHVVEEVVYAIGTQGVLLRKFKDAPWELFQPPLQGIAPKDDLISLWVDPTNPKHVYVGTVSGELWVIGIDGRWYQQLNTNGAITSIFGTSVENLQMLTPDFLYRKNRSQWDIVRIWSDTKMLKADLIPNTNDIFFLGNPDTLGSTLDEYTLYHLASETLTNLYIVNQEEFYVVGNRGLILHYYAR